MRAARGAGGIGAGRGCNLDTGVAIVALKLLGQQTVAAVTEEAAQKLQQGLSQ